MSKRKAPFISLLLFVFIIGLSTSTKQWIEAPDFDNPGYWQSGYLPCSQEEIIFPESYSSAILLPPTVDTIGLTLPKDGAILLPPDSSIFFSRGIDNGRKCKNSNQVAKVKSTSTRAWFDPSNWRSISNDSVRSSLQNPAVPHLERIPCSNEAVRIPAAGPLSIDLNDATILRVGQIELDGVNVSTEFMDRLFKSELGEAMFKLASQTKVEYNKDPMCGCHQPDLMWEYDGNVCQYAYSSCELPKCVAALVTTGHCCAICGVVLKVIVDKCDPSYLTKLTQMIEQSLKEQELEEQINFYVSFMDVVQTYLQVIIVEKDGYEGSSVNFIHRFNETVSWDIFQNSKREFFTSGRAIDPNGFTAALLMMLGTLFAVLVFFAVIFVNFVPDNGIMRLPRWMYVRWYDFAQSPFVFSRFDNTVTTESGRAEETVAIDVQQYNISADYPEREGGTSTSFDNPMFVENPPAKATLQNIDNDIPLREEDLTEIDLEAEIEGKL